MTDDNRESIQEPRLTEYSASSIQVLTGLEAVRRRPGMYVGDVDSGGHHELLWELVSNVLDQHACGNASELRVELDRCGWVTVRDDGPGIPTDPMPRHPHTEPARPDLGDTLDVLEHQRGARPSAADPASSVHQVHEPDDISVLEALCTRLLGWSRGTSWPHVYISGSSCHGVGLAAVNALSEQLVVETSYHGVRWTQAFERGVRTAPLRRLGPTTLEGTQIRFRPDPTIFSTIELDHVRVRARLHELARLHPHLRVYFQEQRLCARGGIAGLARELASECGDVVATLSCAQNIRDVRVELACAWTRSGPPQLRSFVNTRPTRGGTHHEGLWLGFAEYARAAGSPARRVAAVREAVGCGLVAVLNVAIDRPHFAGSTRDHLRSVEALDGVRDTIRNCLAPNDWRGWSTRQFLDARLHVPERRPGSRRVR